MLMSERLNFINEIINKHVFYKKVGTQVKYALVLKK